MAGVSITLAEVVVAISGSVVREHCVLSPAWQACYRTYQGGNCLPGKIDPIHIQIQIIKLHIIWIRFTGINWNLYTVAFFWL